MITRSEVPRGGLNIDTEVSEDSFQTGKPAEKKDAIFMKLISKIDDMGYNGFKKNIRTEKGVSSMSKSIRSNETELESP